MNRKQWLDKLNQQFSTEIDRLPDETIRDLAEGKLSFKLTTPVAGESGGRILSGGTIDPYKPPVSRE